MSIGIHDLAPVIEAALSHGQSVRMVARGNSMRPFIRDGDAVELAAAQSVHVGDIVLGRLREGKYVIHRVVQVDRDALYLRGDAELRREGPVVSNDILGKVRLRLRGGRVCELGSGLSRVAGLLWIRAAPLGCWSMRLIDRLRAHKAGSTCP